MENKHEIFTYTYSAKDQSEVQRIRQKYLPQEEDKMEKLLRLDRSVAHKAQIISLTTGFAGTMLLGLSMCLIMTSLKERLGVAVGVIIGVIGTGMLAAAYPIYQKVSERERERIAPEVIRLTNELMK